MPPKKLPKLDSTQGQRKLSTFFNTESNAESAETNRDEFEGQGPSSETSSTLSC